MKLAAIKVCNYGCIGPEGHEIRIDDIVILIGPNNIGKSLILDAYEAYASGGKELTIKEFFRENENNTVAITGIFNEISENDTDKIGKKYLHIDSKYDECVKVQWKWSKANSRGEKLSWDNNDKKWIPKGVGGWDSLFIGRIPVPLRVKPTDDAEIRQKQIVDIFTSVIKQRCKKDGDVASKVLAELEDVTRQFGDKFKENMEETCDSITEKLDDVFPGYSVEFEPSVGKFEPEKLIGTGSFIRIRAGSEENAPLIKQGSGLQRAFLWSALGALAELGHYKKDRINIDPEKPRILLIDEPESFLHPPMIRRAREALYKLSSLEGWQVMASTHSPIFIDVSKPHTTLVRIGKEDNNKTKVFSSEDVGFDEDERTQLRMIRSCHPTVNEFFFANHVFLVEGETEQLVLCHLLSQPGINESLEYHVVNCMGKANLPLFMRILNHFGTPYTVLHDSDYPKALRKGKYIKNPMWSMNKNIIGEFNNRPKDLPSSYLLVHVPDFECHYFGIKLNKDKPYHAYQHLTRADFETAPELANIRALLENLINHNHPGIYSSEEEMVDKVKDWPDLIHQSDMNLWKFE